MQNKESSQHLGASDLVIQKIMSTSGFRMQLRKFNCIIADDRKTVFKERLLQGVGYIFIHYC